MEQEEGVSEMEWFFDCPQCGHIGTMADMREHPTRPVAMDLGFCPKCGGEIEELISEDQVRALMIEYGDDPDAEMAAIKANPRKPPAQE
jgi:Zn finger protein HypA/HybF involved in hydrogenase expression